MAEDADLPEAVAELRQIVEDLRSELASLRQSSPDADVARDAQKRLLTAAEVAGELAVSQRTLRRLRQNRRFPRPVRGIRPLRWRRGDIQGLLDRRAA